ncbi:MAG TPA: hypothetical protein VFB27_14125 [Opitutaceae bacterium]|nr:hypothetical protein [Opitutaceae bacterium]
MQHQLTPEEKQLVEQEFVARQELAARRRSFARRVFVVGLATGLSAAALHEFHIPTLVSPLLGIVWLVCILIYVGMGVFPATFAKDMDLRWHLNPWQEALQHLSEGRTQAEAIALLAGPILGRMLFAFVYLALR